VGDKKHSGRKNGRKPEERKRVQVLKKQTYTRKDQKPVKYQVRQQAKKKSQRPEGKSTLDSSLARSSGVLNQKPNVTRNCFWPKSGKPSEYPLRKERAILGE